MSRRVTKDRISLRLKVVDRGSPLYGQKKREAEASRLVLLKS